MVARSESERERLRRISILNARLPKKRTIAQGVLRNPAGRLLAVNWLPPWRGWDDALLYLFDLGVHDHGELDPALFLRREIAGAHWCAVPDAAAHVAPYTARMLEVAGDAEHPAYLENSEPVGPR